MSGQRDGDSEEDGLMVRDGQVKALQLGWGFASGAYQVQCVTFCIGGTLNLECCVILKQSSGDRKSEANVQLLEST